MTFEEARAQFPVFERLAYLNAGTNGPLARATVEAMIEQERADLERGRGGGAYFERALALRDDVRAKLAGLVGNDLVPARYPIAGEVEAFDHRFAAGLAGPLAAPIVRGLTGTPSCAARGPWPATRQA